MHRASATPQNYLFGQLILEKINDKLFAQENQIGKGSRPSRIKIYHLKN